MKIAICDDELVFVNQLNEYLWQQSDCTTESFLSPTELLDQYKAGQRYDVIFLDVMMEPMDGISVAHRIREYDKNVMLVFLTAYLEYAPAGYNVSAFRYLLKPITTKDLDLVMTDIRQELRQTHRILFKTPECEILINIMDIYYAETSDKETTIFYSGDALIIKKSLGELEALLPPHQFYRTHRKYLVNLAHVREFDNTHLTLDNHKTLPLSYRRSYDFRAALEKYITGGLK